MAAATCTVTEEIAHKTRKIKWAWTCSSSGNVAASTTGNQTTNIYTGKLVGLHTIGDASSAPTASYDLTILDQSSVDVTAGGGANRAAAVENTVGASLGAVVADKLAISITNAGINKAGTVYLFIQY